MTRSAHTHQALSSSLPVALQITGDQVVNSGRAVAVRGFAARAVAWRDMDPWKPAWTTANYGSTSAALYRS